ncbi:hypothetical protein BBG12_05445 [Staphylococcus haemolyticus]|uniref:restriction endonuclease subunit S n=1 Tax=Staphylococcus haemolyticus TaxID=1283 RepID=UPI000871DA16|nr:restriction endonuclease subunit S [Staphylococcus haemolyticus]OFB46122.1 hypothetical protein BBG12_05445 [Staphylococcus haemolyticus]
MSREMKDSGIEWIGEIPEDWEVVKLGIVADISTGNTLKDPDNIKYSKSEGVDWLKTNNLLGVDGVSNSSLKIKEQYISEARLTNPRSVLVTCIGDIGKLGYTSKPVAFNQQINSITFTKDIIYWKYGMYALYSQREQQESLANGNVLKILNRENQKKVVITVPKDINKQIKISNALDKICLYIRKLVDKTQLSIKELKKYKQSLITESVTNGIDPNVEMKDSGIEWIGMIPKHWTIKKVKYFLSESSVKNYPNETVLSLYRDYGVIPKDSRTDNHNVTSSDTSSYKLIEKNDVVINKMKAWQGSLGVSSFKGIISPAYYVYKIIDSDIYSHFLHYVLRNNLYLDEYRRISSGIRIGQWDLEKKEFEKLLYPFPNSTSEQQQIVQYLDKKIFTIDRLIEDKTKVIEELENYKKSLIYEYVTGKKKYKEGEQ